MHMWNITEKIAGVDQILIYSAIKNLRENLKPCRSDSNALSLHYCRWHDWYCPGWKRGKLRNHQTMIFLTFKVVFGKADGMILILVALWLTSRLYPSGVCVMHIFMWLFLYSLVIPCLRSGFGLYFLHTSVHTSVQ